METNLTKKQMVTLLLLQSTYKSNIINYLKSNCKTLDKRQATYGNLIILKNFNVEPKEEIVVEFLNLCNLRNLVKQNTCFKKHDKPTCIDLILTN